MKDLCKVIGLIVVALLLPGLELAANDTILDATATAETVAATHRQPHYRPYHRPYLGHFRHFAPRGYVPFDAYSRHHRPLRNHRRYYSLHAFGARHWRYPQALLRRPDF